jgi:hypothetical protein
MITINYGINKTGQGAHPYHYISKGAKVYKLSKDQSRLVYLGELAEAIHWDEKRTEMELSDYIKSCSDLDKWFGTFYCPHKLRKELNKMFIVRWEWETMLSHGDGSSRFETFEEACNFFNDKLREEHEDEGIFNGAFHFGDIQQDPDDTNGRYFVGDPEGGIDRYVFRITIEASA